MKYIHIFIFLLLTYSLQAQNTITQYEYWLDGDYANKITAGVSGSEEVFLQKDLDISAATPGFHTFNIRFSDREGRWSSVLSQIIFKMGNDGNESNVIVEYEFWVDDYSNKTNIASENSEEIILDKFLDVSSFSNGFHTFYIRFKDGGGNWSAVLKSAFFKIGNSNPESNLIASYRYWFDNDFDNATEIELPEPIEQSEINLLVPIPSEETESFNIQFKDVGELLSTVFTQLFTPEAEFDIFNTVNTFSFMNKTTFGSSYSWDFGDKTSVVSTKHPTHTYNKPGVYDVCLTAKNRLGSDTLCKIVSVNGLREVVSNKAGNNGFATVLVYGGGLKDGSKVWLEKDGTKYLEATNVRLARLDALEARFDLYGKEIGFYDLVVELPDATQYILEKSFEIVAGTEAAPFASFNGMNRILFGRWQSYTINFGNSGNTDALGVPLYFLITMADGLELEFKNMKIKMSNKWKDNEYYDELSLEPDYIEHVGFFDGDEKVRMYAFYLPVIPAGFSGQVEIKIKTNASFRAYTWLLPSMFEVGPGGIIQKKDDILSEVMDKKTAACLRAVMAQAMKDGIADIVNNVIPGVGCANSILNTVMDPAGYISPEPTNPEYNRPKSWSETFWDWGGKLKDVTLVIAGCASDVLPMKQAFKAAVAVLSVANNIYGGIQAGRECYKKYGGSKTGIAAVSSFDPNEITGPGGYTEKNYVNTDGFAYTIFFENKQDASAPAQEVIILDTLDKTKYDFSTFSFGQFSFSGKYYSPLPGSKQFTLDIDLEETNRILRVNANFDALSGIANWQFITLDAKTMDLTEDPMGGFLPPNQNSPEGEGSVSYLVNIKNSLLNDETIKARAEIIFDLNEPIVTNEYSNSLDYAPPDSKITGIYYTSEPNVYRMSIYGEDKQSGVAYYVIYMSEDDGDYIPIYSTSETYYIFTGEAGKTYKFYSIAVDNVGNEEQAPPDYDVSTLSVAVNENSVSSLEFGLYPNPANSDVNVSFSIQGGTYVSFKIFNSLGGECITTLRNSFYNAGTHNIKLDTRNLPTGLYTVQMILEGKAINKKLVIIK